MLAVWRRVSGPAAAAAAAAASGGVVGAGRGGGGGGGRWRWRVRTDAGRRGLVQRRLEVGPQRQRVPEPSEQPLLRVLERSGRARTGARCAPTPPRPPRARSGRPWPATGSRLATCFFEVRRWLSGCGRQLRQPPPRAPSPSRPRPHPVAPTGSTSGTSAARCSSGPPPTARQAARRARRDPTGRRRPRGRGRRRPQPGSHSAARQRLVEAAEVIREQLARAGVDHSGEQVAEHRVGHAAVGRAQRLGPQQRRHTASEQRHTGGVGAVVGDRQPARDPLLATADQRGPQSPSRHQLERQLDRLGQKPHRVPDRDATARAGACAALEPEVEPGRRAADQAPCRRRTRAHRPPTPGEQTAAPAAGARRQRAAAAEMAGGRLRRRQHQRQLAFDRIPGRHVSPSRSNTSHNRPFSQANGCGRGRGARRAAGLPARACGQRRFLPPEAQPRVARPEGVQNDHARHRRAASGRNPRASRSPPPPPPNPARRIPARGDAMTVQTEAGCRMAWC